MTTPLMPRNQTWVSEDGVEIEMIPYRTILVDILREGLKSHMNQDGTMPDVLASFILCAGTTTDVHLPAENAPEWGRWLHETIKTPGWRKDIAKTYDNLAFAPSGMIEQWWEAYLGTRDESHPAANELKQDKPQKPLPNPDTGEVDQTALNFTSESKPDGVKPLTIMSLSTPKNQQTGRRQKAK